MLSSAGRRCLMGSVASSSSEDEIVALMVRNLGLLLMVLGFGC